MPKAAFIFPSETPDETVTAYLDRYPQHDRFLLSGDQPQEWDVAEPFDFYKVGAVRHLHWNLKMLGPVDIIVDAWQGDGECHLANLHTLFFHLRRGGQYVIPWFAVTADRAPLIDRLEQISRRLVTRPRPDERRTETEFIRSVADIDIDRREVRIGKRGNHLLKLRDDEASRVLPHRSPVTVDEVATTKPGTLSFSTSTASLGSSRPMPYLVDSVDYPALHLRHYEGKIGLVSNSLVYTKNSVLPDSFRHHLEEIPKNPRLTPVTPDFARLQPQFVPKERLTGSYYLLDSENSGHYGHLMTEVISRLWGWDQAKAADPDLKALFRIRHTNERIPHLEQTLFGAYGIAPDDIVWTDHPVWLDSAWGATPQFHNQKPHYVHPGIIDTWRRIGDGLPAGAGQTYDKIFISRGNDLKARRCLNQPAVEEVFRQVGYEIILPERYPLAEQAHIFRNARVIAGFGGSAMFNAIYAEQLEHLIILNQEAYTARNEHLIALALGVQLTYLWSRPTIEHPEGSWSREAYRSDWSFDFDRNGDDLRRVTR